MPQDTSDEAYAREALTHKEEFAVLIERYQAKLTRYLERLGVSSPEDREDVLQNAFIKAYRNLASFDQSLSFSSWMYRITHNEAMSFFRYKRARPSLVLGEDQEKLLSQIADEDADASSSAEQKIETELLAKAFQELDPQFRDVLTLRYFEERSYNEISDILRVPLGTVSTLIYRAKQMLKKLLPKNPHD